MRLAVWRIGQGWTQAELALRLRCTQGFISVIERAEDPQIPGRSFMVEIFRLTMGAVTPNDFYDLPALEQLSLPMEEAAPLPLLDAAEAAAAQPQLQDAA